MQLQKSASAGRRDAKKTKKPGSYFHIFLPITESRKEAKKDDEEKQRNSEGKYPKKGGKKNVRVCKDEVENG